jgi:KUP system potassium uptake protein
VFGDIGTSPLYAMHDCFSGEHGAAITRDNVFGVLSLIFWALIIIVTVKYLALVLRADNRGEGGILALMALVGTRADKTTDPRRYVLILMGLFGAALLYGDGMITPSISVLSAIEGLGVATKALQPFVVPITIAILVGLFLVQNVGTGKVGMFFGPVMLLWFIVLAILGIRSSFQNPEIFGAISPHHAIDYFRNEGTRGVLILGGVFLVVTGGEALYADMGHFGRRPIRLMWFSLALPALLLNYFGQGALLLRDPSSSQNLFFRLAPDWALYPLVILAALATVIASQALISASFSLTRQAVQLGYSPRVEIIHTSSREIGQIYVPGVNWALMLACVGLVWGFKSSAALASAYGLAVTMTMVITTVLFFAFARTHWKWGIVKSVAICLPLLFVDFIFFGANVVKIADGGWFPLAVGILIFTAMTTWKRGREILGRRQRASALPLDIFFEDVESKQSIRVPGLAVFMSGNDDVVPHAMLHNLKHNKVLHERNVILTIRTEEVPYVPQEERLTIEVLHSSFWRMTARYGFMEDPNVMKLLEEAKRQGFEYKLSHTTFFLGRETIIASKRPGMAIWRERLFATMSVNARSATAYFGLPANRVVEMGAQIEI